MIIPRIPAINILYFLIGLTLFFFACQSSTSRVGPEEEHEEEEIDPDYTTIPELIGARGKFRPQDHENVIQSLVNTPSWTDGVYINVRVTADGVPVLMHDATIDRTTDGSGRVNSFRLDEIKELDAGDGSQVPTLDEYLQVIRNREEADTQQPFSRIFMNPNDQSPAAIDSMYSVAMDARFESLADRYVWQFGNLLNNDSGAIYLRSLDDNAKIGTFLSDATKVEEMMNVMEAVNGETILLWPGQYNNIPETLQTIADHGFEGGISRVSSNNLHVIPIAHDDPNVKVLFTWHTDELSWWYPDE